MSFARPRKPLRESRLALVTTGGVHLPEGPRFDIDDPSGDCSYREIPSDAHALTWTHAYYAPDRGTDLDSVFPLWTLRGLVAEGVVGELNRRHFSFMGAIDRKSTRLNSSHANISYAVFCLKKKKNSNK